MTTTDDDFAEFEDSSPTVAPAKRSARKPAAKKAPAKKAASKIPPNVKQPQDHKKPTHTGDKARRREADGVAVVDIPITTKAGGSMVATIPLHQGDWSVRTVQFFVRDQHLDGVAALFGPEQWEQYLALDPTMNDLAATGQLVTEELGLENPGN